MAAKWELHPHWLTMACHLHFSAPSLSDTEWSAGMPSYSSPCKQPWAVLRWKWIWGQLNREFWGFNNWSVVLKKKHNLWVDLSWPCTLLILWEGYSWRRATVEFSKCESRAGAPPAQVWRLYCFPLIKSTAWPSDGLTTGGKGSPPDSTISCQL